MLATTDGRWFAQPGIQPYGLSPLLLRNTLEFQKLVHAANERVPTAAIETRAAIIVDLLASYPGEHVSPER